MSSRNKVRKHTLKKNDTHKDSSAPSLSLNDPTGDPVSPAGIATNDENDDEVTIANDAQYPSTYSVVRRNRMYRIPDTVMFTDAQHRPCGCLYCRIYFYPEDDVPVELIRTKQWFWIWRSKFDTTN